MNITHQKKSSEYFKIAERHWGFRPKLLRRIGLLVILWGLFETKLEVAVWRLLDEDVAGRRPSTDGKGPYALIKALRAGSPRLNESACDVLKQAADAAENLMNYRHSLIHGNMIPSAEMPSFLRNASWYGEIRLKGTGEAFVTENLLDMAIDSVGTLCKVALATQGAFRNRPDARGLMVLEPDVHRAVSQTGELRDLVAAVNHEKY
jgi:hypothetical protein